MRFPDSPRRLAQDADVPHPPCRPTPLRHFILPSASTADSALISTLSTLTPPYTLAAPSSTLPLFPHAGQTRNLLSAFLATPSPVRVAALLIYASEGDNEHSAEFLAEALVRAVGVQAERKDGEGWTRPGSWAIGLMGLEMGRERMGEMFG